MNSIKVSWQNVLSNAYPGNLNIDMRSLQRSSRKNGMFYFLVKVRFNLIYRIFKTTHGQYRLNTPKYMPRILSVLTGIQKFAAYMIILHSQSRYSIYANLQCIIEFECSVICWNGIELFMK